MERFFYVIFLSAFDSLCFWGPYNSVNRCESVSDRS